MQAIRLADMIGSKGVEIKDKIGKIVKDHGEIGTNDFLKKIIEKNEGVDELVDCLLKGDFSCFFKNLDWLVQQVFYNNTLSCILGATSQDPIDPDRLVSSGACYTFWGIPGVGSPQACSKFDSVPKSVSTCKAKCTSAGAIYESAGCDGASLWCWCRTD